MRATPRAAARASKLVEVARTAGVSPSTVSRILNGTAFVADDKRAAVEAAIARLGFQPNPVARGLRQGRRMTVGILAQDVDSPFFGTTFRGIAEELSGSEYAPLILGGPSSPESEAERIELLLSRRVDGIIVVTCRLTDEELLRFSRAVPLVVAGRHLRKPNLFTIHVDNVRGGKLATAHLLGLGHRRIAHLQGPLDHQDAGDRLEGYRRALRAARLRFDAGLVVPAGFLPADGLAAMERLLGSGRPFTAVFAANDECALGARLALHRRGLRVPQDVSLVGFDDLPGARFATPPLTTVRQPLQEIGRRAARSLLDLLGGRRPPAAGMPAVELVVRETTARPR